MIIGIASHTVLDSITGTDGNLTESIGGPPCYAGLTSRRFGFDVVLATRVGADFPKEPEILSQNRIWISDQQRSDSESTTRFSIVPEGDSRSLKVLSKCRALTPDDVVNMKVDCWLVSPVIDEVPKDVFEAIKLNGGNENFVMLDPQGYMRVIDQGGLVTLKERLELDLSGIRAIKVDQQEMSALARGMDGLGGMQFLQSVGIEFVIGTVGKEIHLLHRNTHYWVKLGNTEATDSTGAGDILSAAFCCSYMKENDALWALCFGAGAVRAALETGRPGLAKVPSIKKIEESATYFYHTVGFKQLS